MRTFIAIFLALHGVAHLVGFLIPWRFISSEETPYSTTLLAGRLDVGDAGIRVVGILWLLLAGAFVWSAWALWSQAPGAQRTVLGVTVASLVLCVLGWPEARIGVFVNLAILVGLVTLGL